MTRKPRSFFGPARQRTGAKTGREQTETKRVTETGTEAFDPDGYGSTFGPDFAGEFGDEFGDELGDDDGLDFGAHFGTGEDSAARRAPSLPIILFSAASGVAGGIIALFVSYRWLQWGIELSAGVATLVLLFSLGVSGAILSAATGSRAAPVNIFFSCGVILLAIFFLAICLLVGAIFGTVLVWL